VHLVAFSSITLEDGVMIGEYASLRDANHRIVSQGSMRHSGHEGKPIIVRRNAWLGRGVTVLGGVTIGEGAVIGANAVVTKDIPAGAVAVGVPARVIKT
jgi:acetyltransferase-like isoleucine patch superfamily enzyme